MRTISLRKGSIGNAYDPRPIWGEYRGIPSIRYLEFGRNSRSRTCGSATDGDGALRHFHAGLPIPEFTGIAYHDGLSSQLATPSMVEAEVRRADRVIVDMSRLYPFDLIDLAVFDYVRAINPRIEIALRIEEPFSDTAAFMDGPPTLECESGHIRKVGHGIDHILIVENYARFNFSRATCGIVAALPVPGTTVEHRESELYPDIFELQSLVALGNGIPTLAQDNFTRDLFPDWGDWLERAARAEWLKVEADRRAATIDYQITDRGRAAVSGICPELFDPAIFEKFETWLSRGLDVSLPEIDAYANRFHAVQSAYLGRGRAAA